MKNMHNSTDRQQERKMSKLFKHNADT